MRAETVTLDDLKEWSPLVSVADASRALGMAVSTAYGLIRVGSFPVPLFKIGCTNKVRTADLLRFLTE